jgi:NADPH:quinone reductase-like Zn-dependent oxidoreductase
MAAVLLTGHGGFDKLVYREDVPVPTPGEGEVLIEVGAAGVNNTDINTRIAWYSKGVAGETSAGGEAGFDSAQDQDGSWSGTPITFPRIQGADACGRIVAAGEGVEPSRIGERVLVRNMLRSYVNWRPFECWTLGSECDGGFAQYVKAPAKESYAVRSEMSDVELASFPCAWSTAENLLHRSGVGAGERVLITGSSGGVGSAAVQLARLRKAEVIGVAGAGKADSVLSLGADQVLDRNENLVSALGREAVDVVVDLVAGPGWPDFLDILRRGGRYATAGAIAGPVVSLDVRTLYLKDLTFFGCTFQDDEVFENLIRAIQSGKIRPVVAKTYPLQDIVQAQKDFLSKKHTGKLVLVPPGTS